MPEPAFGYPIKIQRAFVVAMLFLGKSCCSICHEVLLPGQAMLSTTHFIADETDPLNRYSDTGMHVACFLNWEHRDEFASKYFAVMGIKLTGWVPAIRANPDAALLPKSKIVVLGTPEEREDLMAALQRDESSTGDSTANQP